MSKFKPSGKSKLPKMAYKGYEAVYEYDEDAKLFRGEVVNGQYVFTFQAASIDRLERAFRDSVDEYLAFCLLGGENSEKGRGGAS